MNIEQKNIVVSYQENTWSRISTEITVQETLQIIGSDKLKTIVENLRNELKKGNKEYYDNNKKKLPAVTFSATFDKNRKKENLKLYTSLLVIDIDKLSDDEMKRINEILKKDKYVFSFWRSPSNKGFKGLICINYNKPLKNEFVDFQHKVAFKTISDYFLKEYQIELDSSGSDITRLCFLSFDDGIVIKDIFSEFEIEISDFEKTTTSNSEKKIVQKFSSNKDALYNSQDRNNPYDRKLMSNIIRFLNNRNCSITDSYEDWCKVAMAIANTFTFDVGKNYFIKLSKRDSAKFNETNCENFLSNCYENRKGEVAFASIVYLANKKGYKTKYQKNGVPKVENF
ncbi:BT4734/BF3469 family protein [Flavobacterium sp. HNIBRBA15423]|uniref:BT4734/BF3469 family protein n=1 Tax=Flavobacterium sp. HNIBRBA15423 TaxID=3458683 RepID=UPI004044F99F